MAAQAIPAPPYGRPTPRVKVERRPDGVVVVALAPPSATQDALGRDLVDALDALFADATVRAVVLRGEKDAFSAGVHLAFVREIRFAQDAEDVSREVARRFEAIARAPKPVVALVHGRTLGGGFELALACTAAVATDDPATLLGLPDVALGLVPAANGLLRVAERAGLRVALDLGTTGRSVRPDEALRLGLVDDVVSASIALDTAAELALRLAGDPKLAHALARTRGHLSAAERIERALVERNPLGRAALFRRARAELSETSHGHRPAAEHVVDLLARFGARGFRSAAELEPRVFGDLVVSETARRLIDVWFSQMSLERSSGLLPGESAELLSVERVGVLGAGLMGAGIACVTAQAGLSVRMKDTDDVAVGRGLRYMKDVLDARARRGALTIIERDAALARVTGTTEYAGFRNADLVMEAVFEDLDLKRAVLREVDALVRDDCVIASSTSAIPIARIAEASTRPERVVGMHYGSPVPKRPLLEVVRTKLADPRAIATAVALGRRQGKTVIVVDDGPAFYSTRILAPYLNEALHLLCEGSSIEAIDRAMVAWGFPVGPFQLMDGVGIDLTANVLDLVHAAFGARIAPPRAMSALRADSRRGKKNARGFYLHGRHAPKRRTVDETVYAVIGMAPRTKAVLAEEIALRCGLAMVNEALLAHDGGIVRSARDGDLGAIFGVGFPAFRGGPFRYVDVLGAPEVLRRMRSLEQRFGDRFAPAPLLVDMARNGKRFYG